MSTQPDQKSTKSPVVIPDGAHKSRTVWLWTEISSDLDRQKGNLPIYLRSKSDKEIYARAVAAATLDNLRRIVNTTIGDERTAGWSSSETLAFVADCLEGSAREIQVAALQKASGR